MHVFIATDVIISTYRAYIYFTFSRFNQNLVISPGRFAISHIYQYIHKKNSLPIFPVYTTKIWFDKLMLKINLSSAYKIQRKIFIHIVPIPTRSSHVNKLDSFTFSRRKYIFIYFRLDTQPCGFSGGKIIYTFFKLLSFLNKSSKDFFLFLFQTLTDSSGFLIQYIDYSRKNLLKYRLGL